MPSAPARYVSGGAGLVETSDELWNPNKDFQTGNTGNADSAGVDRGARVGALFALNSEVSSRE
jgi:hypothetical protein